MGEELIHNIIIGNYSKVDDDHICIEGQVHLVLDVIDVILSHIDECLINLCNEFHLQLNYYAS